MSAQQSGFSRRDLLKGLAALGIATVAGSAASLRHARAQTSPTSADIAAFIRFKIGDSEAAVISDGAAAFNPGVYAVNAPEGGIDAALRAVGINPANNVASFLLLLVQAGDEWVLFDTGNGAKAIPTMAVMGVQPEQINKVVISHFHPDHIGGMLRDGSPAFPEASYHFPAAEHAFLQNDLSGTPLAGVAGMANRTLAAVESQLSFYNDGDELALGVVAMSAPGHSPGHSAFTITSGGQTVLNMVDAALSSYVSLAHPDWFAGFDADGPLASETRKALLSRAASDNLLAFGYHFPFPGIGYVAPQDEGYRFIPAAF